MTVHEAVDAGVRILTNAGFPADEARLDAGVLARHLLSWSLTDWAAGGRRAAPAGFPDQLNALATRRAGHEPVAYITGVREFYGRTFAVSPAVLIPRPETEGLVEAALTLGLRPDSRIADVGTGSGCIAVSLALEWPRAQITATDASVSALELARENARALGARQIEFVEANLLPDSPARFDLIVSNPPYVPEFDRASIMPEVREFEPESALFAGDDGLDVIRRLIPMAAGRLNPGGWLLIEIGAGQDHAVTELVTAAGLRFDRFRPDLSGIPRVLVAHEATRNSGRPAG